MNLEHPKRTILHKTEASKRTILHKIGVSKRTILHKTGVSERTILHKTEVSERTILQFRHSTIKHFTISERIAFPIKNYNSLPRTYPIITMHHHAHTHKSYQNKTGNAILVDIYLFILPSKNINIIFANTASLIKPFIYDYKGGNCTL